MVPADHELLGEASAATGGRRSRVRAASAAGAGRRRSQASGAVAVLCGAALLAACGSSGTASRTSDGPTSQTCRAVAAVLSDGPDPTSDPVGYAQAQILPLRQIPVSSDRSLATAIDDLAAAYEQFVEADGTGATVTHQVRVAVDRINGLCPDAGAVA